MTISQPSDITGLTTDIDPHVEAYQDAAGTTPAADGDPIGLLVDQVGSVDFSQSTTSQKLTLSADANGWLRAIGDGVDDVDRASSSFDVPSASVTWAGEIFGSAANNAQVLFSGSTYTNGMCIQFNYSLGRFEGYVNGNSIVSAGSLTVGEGNLYVVTLAYNGTQMELTVNGVSSTPVAETGSLTVTGLLGILNRNTASRPTNGSLYRLLMWDATAISSSDASDLYDYLDSLYSSPPGGSGPNSGAGIVSAIADVAGVGTAQRSGSGSVSIVAATQGTASTALSGGGSVSVIASVNGSGSTSRSGSGSVSAIADTQGDALSVPAAGGPTAAIAGVEGVGSTQHSGSGAVAAATATQGVSYAVRSAGGTTAAIADAIGSSYVTRSAQGSVEAIGETEGTGPIFVGTATQCARPFARVQVARSRKRNVAARGNS